MPARLMSSTTGRTQRVADNAAAQLAKLSRLLGLLGLLGLSPVAERGLSFTPTDDGGDAYAG
jgi:hypothetical protein